MKTQMKKFLRSGMLLTFVFAFMFTIRAGAYGLTQVNPQPNSVTLQWTAPKGVTGYTVQLGSSSSDMKVVSSLASSATSYTIAGLAAGSRYYVRLEYTYTSGSKTSSDYYYDYFITTPGKVTNVHQDKWWYFAKDFEVVWDKQPYYGNKYEYLVKTSKGKTKDSGTTSSSSLFVNNISNSMIYTVQVRASNVINGKTYTGDWSDVCYCFTQPRVKYAKVKGNKLTIKWGKVTGATGYDVYVSTKPKKGYKKVKSAKSKASSVTISKLKGKKISPKKKYYVYVVTKKKVNGKTNTSGRLYYWNTKSTRYDYF